MSFLTSLSQNKKSVLKINLSESQNMIEWIEQTISIPEEIQVKIFISAMIISGVIIIRYLLVRFLISQLSDLNQR
ncbi:MAG: hypothetical protein P8Y79_02750 [Ignavibacteriaceae bacterium]